MCQSFQLGKDSIFVFLVARFLCYPELNCGFVLHQNFPFTEKYHFYGYYKLYSKIKGAFSEDNYVECVCVHMCVYVWKSVENTFSHNFGGFGGIL